MTEYKISFKPDIQGLEEALGPFGMIFKDKYESVLLNMGVMIWNIQCEIANKGVIERFNKEWEAAHGGEFGEAYEEAYNTLTEEITRDISKRYPIKMPMGQYIVLLRDGTECINFKPPVDGELYGTGVVKMRLERVDS